MKSPGLRKTLSLVMGGVAYQVGAETVFGLLFAKGSGIYLCYKYVSQEKMHFYVHTHT